MTWMRTSVAKARERRRSGSAGFSLIETLVAVSIFAVFMGTVMAGIIAMLGSVQKTTSLEDGSSTLENAFQKLDHQVRYADAITGPTVWNSASPANQYVEWHSPATSLAPAQCTQLKYDVTALVLEERTWQPGVSPVVATAWSTLATNITSVVFWRQIAGPISPAPNAPVLAHPYLTVTLYAQPNGRTKARSEASESQATFTALNSNGTSNVVCGEVARS